MLPVAPHCPSLETLPPPPGPEQVPNPAWQPAPRWAAVPPQKPLDEQQSPYSDPVQTLPLAPHWPSDVVLPVLTHVPKPGWQPAPQWAGVEPHHPPEEQQSPKVVPVQLNWAVPPQEPSGEGLPGPATGGGGALQLPKPGWL